MKQALYFIAVLLFLFGGYTGIAHFSGGAFPTLGLPLGGERALLREITNHFMEDIQFKDFEAAAGYHAPENIDGVDIPFLLERLFAQKPELLDIMDYEIVMADIDSSGNRARVKTRIKVKNLAQKDIYTRELMLFFQRADAASPWYMELESSLRSLTGDKEKKH